MLSHLHQINHANTSAVLLGLKAIISEIERKLLELVATCKYYFELKNTDFFLLIGTN